jgi:sugar phosphate isomerase/epimerase
MRFAICNEIFQGWKLEDTVRFVAETGYEGLEIAPFTLAKDVREISLETRARIRTQAEQARIAITGIHWILAQTEGLHLTHSDPAVRDRTAKYLCDLVNFCGDIGGHILVLGSPKQRNILEGVDPQQAWKWARTTLEPAVTLAMNRGLTICLEPLSPAETNFINTAEEAIRLVQQVRCPSLRIILDVKAMSSEAKPIPDIIRASWPHFAYVHANDKNLKGPGFGEVDFVPIFAALKEVGYTGWVSVEVFNFDEGPEVIARQSLANLKKACAAAPFPASWE